VLLYYEEVAQVEIVSPRGVRILIDVHEPKNLPQQPTADGVVLTTHLHSDHSLARFAVEFPGQQLRAAEGSIALKDVQIRGIAASHTALPPDGPTGSNYIFIMDIGGLRIVHLGDTEQEALTAEQVAAIGRTDVAIAEFWVEPKGRFYRIMDQRKPLLIVATHLGVGAPERAKEKWSSYWSGAQPLILSTGRLPRETSVVFLGYLADAFGELLKAPEWRTR